MHSQTQLLYRPFGQRRFQLKQGHTSPLTDCSHFRPDPAQHLENTCGADWRDLLVNNVWECLGSKLKFDDVGYVLARCPGVFDGSAGPTPRTPHRYALYIAPRNVECTHTKHLEHLCDIQAHVYHKKSGMGVHSIDPV